jgi:hypothetical protein
MQKKPFLVSDAGGNSVTAYHRILAGIGVKSFRVKLERAKTKGGAEAPPSLLKLRAV